MDEYSKENKFGRYEGIRPTTRTHTQLPGGCQGMHASAHDHIHRSSGFGGAALPPPPLVLPVTRRNRAAFVVPATPAVPSDTNRATQHARHLRSNSLVTVPPGTRSWRVGAVGEATALCGGVLCRNGAKVRRRRIGGALGIGEGFRGGVLNMNMKTDEAERVCDLGVDQTMAALIAKGV